MSDSTQPCSEDPLVVEKVHNEDRVWGWLIPLADGLKSVALKNQAICAGRDSDVCSVVFESITFDGKGCDIGVEKVSRIHFQINFDPIQEKTTLEDLSMNGTWVNGIRVGKKNMIVMEHCSAISILSKTVLVFSYLDIIAIEKSFPRSLTTNYLVGRKLGEGTTSIVHLGYRRIDSSEVALKIIKTTSWPSKYSQPVDMMSEVNVLAGLEHPCITKVEEVIEDNTSMTIVMEFARGGELFDRVVDDYRKNKLTERMAKLRFYQVVEAVRYLHSNNVCHRDLKLENLLLADDGPCPLIKVSDFGLSKCWEGDILHSYVGTPVYMAPEVLVLGTSDSDNEEVNSSYTSKADCWSLGVILYLLLSCKHPFNKGDNLSQNILTGRFNSMKGIMWENISSTAKSLVRALLEVNPSKRLSAEQILQHRWFTQDIETVLAARKIIWKVEARDDTSKRDSGINLSTVRSKRPRKEIPLIDLTEDTSEE